MLGELTCKGQPAPTTRAGIIAALKYAAEQRATTKVIGPEWERAFADTLSTALASMAA